MPPLSTWQPVLINKSNRPILTQDEHNVCIRDGIGLYQGRLKIKNYQNGRLYLTNKRIIWLDSLDQQQPIAINLLDVTKAEIVEGFFRSSPKMKAYLRENKSPTLANSRTPTNTGSSVDVQNSTVLIDAAGIDCARGASPEFSMVNWVCVICLYNNQLLAGADLSALPACVLCGIQPSRTQIDKVLSEADDLSRPLTGSGIALNLDQCPKCTFVNHPSMRNCELCGTMLYLVSSSLLNRLQSMDDLSAASLVSENPMGLQLEEKEDYTNSIPYVKFSFRKGGEAKFFQHLVDEIHSTQWLALKAKGAINGDAAKVVQSREQSPQKDLVGGIRGLEKLDELKRKQNELVLSLSLDDFEQLMYKAQDILELASIFRTVIKPQRHTFPQGSSTIPPLVFNKSSRLYHQELARHISEFLLNYELTSMTSMITLQDLFASYNRFLILSQGFGSELMPPQDLNKSLEFLDRLKLPVRLKSYQSGLVVVARRAQDLPDLHRVIWKYVVEEENNFMYQKFRSQILADNDGYIKDKFRVFKGLTVSQIADHYGWSPAVCVEELERCIGEQLLVIDEHVSGTFYFANIFDLEASAIFENEKSQQERARTDVLQEQKLISDKLKNSHDADQNLLRVSDYEFGSERLPEQSPLPASINDSMNQLSGLRFT